MSDLLLVVSPLAPHVLFTLTQPDREQHSVCVIVMAIHCTIREMFAVLKLTAVKLCHG